MRNFIIMVAAVMALCLFGCGPKVNTVPYSQAPTITPGPNETIVYIMREWGFASSGRNFVVMEDGDTIGSLATDSYMIHRTGAEEHFYSVDGNTHGTTISPKPGETKYILVSVTGSHLTVSEISKKMALKLLPKMEYVVLAQ